MKKLLTTIFLLLIIITLLAGCSADNLPMEYYIDDQGSLIAVYKDGTEKNLGSLADSVANGVESVSISDDGYYVINDVKTDIIAKSSYQVTFDSGYSTNVPMKRVLEGHTVSRPELDRKGYTFVGWFCNGEEWRFNSDLVYHDMELKAEWIANEYNISFYNEMGESPAGMTVNYDEVVSLPLLDEVVGYTFDGWYYDNIKVNNGEWKIDANVTLVAKWSPNIYTVTLDANGGELSSKTYSVEYGKTYTLPIPTNDYGTFKGWYYNDQKLTDEFGVSLNVWSFTKNITLTTSWITEVYTAQDLLNIRDALNGHYVLMNNIDVSGLDWVPLGSEKGNNGLTSDNFTGVIDGNYFAINGLSIDTYSVSQSSYGFVGYNYGTIKNLKLTNVNINITDIQNDTYAGGICGYNEGTIINCSVSGTIKISNHSGSYDSTCGGITAYNAIHDNSDKELSNVEIIDCSNQASITASTYAGGIVGLSSGSFTFERFINLGDIAAKYAGGIAGYSYGDTFYQCKNEGAINGSQQAGGILGATHNDLSSKTKLVFTQCANLGAVASADATGCNAGGIAGAIYCATTVNDCYNCGNITGCYVAGIVGFSQTVNVIISNSINNGTLSASNYSGGIVGFVIGVQINNCINFGNIKSGLVKGYIITLSNYNVICNNCYYSYQSGNFTDADASGIEETLLQITDIELYEDYLFWDIVTITNTDGIWVVDGTNNPYLSWEK